MRRPQHRRLSIDGSALCVVGATASLRKQHANLAAVTYSAMAPLSVTTVFTGRGNQGLQVGYNTGSIQTHIHAPGKYPLYSALTNTSANGALLRRTSGDPATALVLRALPPRCRLCRPWNAARPDPRAMRCASIASSAGAAEGSKVGARI
jgi:hypothetical protein